MEKEKRRKERKKEGKRDRRGETNKEMKEEGSEDGRKEASRGMPQMYKCVAWTRSLINLILFPFICIPLKVWDWSAYVIVFCLFVGKGFKVALPTVRAFDQKSYWVEEMFRKIGSAWRSKEGIRRPATGLTSGVISPGLQGQVEFPLLPREAAPTPMWKWTRNFPQVVIWRGLTLLTVFTSISKLHVSKQ